MQQFWLLSTERSLGFGVVGPIPVSKIEERGFRSGLDDCMIGPFVRIIMEMDEVFREWTREELKRASKTKGG